MIYVYISGAPLAWWSHPRTAAFATPSIAQLQVHRLQQYPGHWIVTGQIFGNRLNLTNPYKNLYKPIKPYKPHKIV